MKKSSIIGGSLSGLLCVVCLLVYVSSVRTQADSARMEAMEKYGGEKIEVFVAKKDIYPGETLNNSNVELKVWLSDLLPDEALVNADSAWGKQVSSLVVKGEVVSEKRFRSDVVEIEVPEGLVALSVPAKDVQAVGGSLFPGNYVDVYATGTQTTCLGKKVLVLATNASEGEKGSKASVSWVTLAVSPEKAQEYVTASQSMDIYFTLPAFESNKGEKNE